MGGTSFDVGMIKDGEPERATAVGFEGYAVQLPVLDIRSIGTGGGSIAYLDTGWAPRVGPRSAGAFSVPTCMWSGLSTTFPFAVHEVLNRPVPFRAKELIINQRTRQLFGLAPVHATPQTGARG
jgi:N-methylhydantoinase A